VDVVLRMPSEPSNLSSVTTYELRRLEPSTPRPQMLALEVRRFQGLAPHAGRTHAGGSEDVRRFQGLAPHAGRTHAGGSEPHAA
jgi:hypothetical protein